MIDISIIDWIVADINFKDEEAARAWLFTLLRKKYKRYCYKIEDVWTSNKPFDSIIDIWNNVKYFVEFKYDRHKKFDPDKIKETTLKQLEPLQMVTLYKLKDINSDLFVVTYVRSIKTFLLFKY